MPFCFLLGAASNQLGCLADLFFLFFCTTTAKLSPFLSSTNLACFFMTFSNVPPIFAARSCREHGVLSLLGGVSTA